MVLNVLQVELLQTG